MICKQRACGQNIYALGFCLQHYNKFRYWQNPEYHRARSAQYRKKHQSRRKQGRRVHNLKQYGITVVQYEKLLSKQQGKCAICKIGRNDLGRRLAVDHDHNTKKVRGLLCGLCNRGLGYFKDDLKLLRQAVKYVGESWT